jgi:hypothetical protein
MLQSLCRELPDILVRQPSGEMFFGHVSPRIIFLNFRVSPVEFFSGAIT